MKKSGIEAKAWFEGLFIILVGIIGIVASLNIKNNPQKITSILKPLAEARFFPLVISVLIVLIGIGILIKNIRKEYHTASVSKEEWLRVLIAIVFIVGYLVLIEIKGIPFWLATGLFLLVSLWFYNAKTSKLKTILLSAIIFTVAASWLLPMIMRLRLPT